jgi:hypothetical protein
MPDYDDIEATCKWCGFSGMLEDFDVIGACPGNLFCNQCATEFNSETGLPALLCGECWGCQNLRDVGEFSITQKERISALRRLN